MEPVNPKEARRCPGELVKSAEHGECTVITHHDKRVACIVPFQEEPSPGFPELAKFREPIKIKGKPLSELVIENRPEARY